MAINTIQQSLDQLTLTSTSVTLGYQPGNTEVPKVLCLWAASTATVTLPPINTTIPTGTTAPVSLANYNPGAQPLTIEIKCLTGSVVNVSASGTDKFYAGDSAIVISSTGAHAAWVGSATDGVWYAI